ncbi:MAG TPA: drug/metabolite exporter YedA [Gammaproteobacteria bacterium]|nr:drug/metabolite exporter YedA [Gammaproteobacteria bacterium]
MPFFGLPGRILAALLAVYLIWGSTYLAISVTLRDLAPFVMASSRFLTAGALLYLWLRLVRREPAPPMHQWAGSAALSFLLLLIGHGGVVFAQQWVPSSLAALAVASMPIWAAVFASFAGRLNRPLDILAIVLGFVGVVFLNLDGALRGAGPGMLALIVAPLAWAFGSMFSHRLPAPGGLMMSATQMLTGGLWLALASLALGEPAPERLTLWPFLGWLWQVVAGSLVAFTAYLYLLNHVRPALATSYAFVNPVIAVLLGVGLAGERLDPWGWLGTVIIVTAVAVLTLGKK